MDIRSGPRWITATVLTLSVGLTAQFPALAATTPPLVAGKTTPARIVAEGKDRAFTLITGDRVILTGGDLAKPRVEPGPGRKQVPFRVQHAHGRLLVVPSDVAADVSAGKLDRRLFDITTLLDDRYDDAGTTSIPLIITYSGQAKRSALSAATTTHNLPAINASAVKVAKKDAATFLNGIRTARSAAAAAPTKIWLDSKRKVALDQSVPQIGAPAAWKAGYTGKGVKIAVLDTGVDATHPDLADRVVAQQNFTAEGPDDEVGHGTHVASIIAGSGAASGGRYRGVAPDATLYAGKVCGVDDCPESSILAGMEWAATEVHATAVNLSVGGQDTAELDPLEQAVNRLTAQTGTLFVIAAGNDGPDAGTIESPGSADAALTVGAVDKQDKLADFSSRGPRIGDGAIKPDVVAPGVSIVAAKAKNSTIGAPVGDYYLRLDGTSMATPHATGSIALLAQQHQAWQAADLKGALMASAKPLAGLSVFEQGAGRIDVGKATQQTLNVAPGNIPFGTAAWPHQDDTPITRQVTYHNSSDQPATVTLTLQVTGPDGEPVTASPFQLSAGTLTVPADGSASVDLTSDTRALVADGKYGGRLIATAADGRSVSTLLTVNKEVESYSLTVKLLGPDGQPHDGDAFIYGLDNDYNEIAPASGGTLTRRIPKGRYLIEGYQYMSDQGPVYEVLSPNTTVAADSTLTFDARTAKPYDVTVPNPDATPIESEVHYGLTTRTEPLDVYIFNSRPQDLYTAQLGEPNDELKSWLSSQWVKVDADGNFSGTPFYYYTVDVSRSGFPTGLTRKVRPGDLAGIDQQVNRTSNNQVALVTTGTVGGRQIAINWQPPVIYDVPAKRRLYVDTGTAKWSTTTYELAGNRIVGAVASPETTYRAGHTYQQRLNVAAFAPTPRTATRSRDELSVYISPTTDATGGVGRTTADTESTMLFRDGLKIAESPTFGRLDTTGLPPEKASYVLEANLTRPTYSTYSTRITGRWSFSSSAEQTRLPLLGIRYQPTVDANNTVARSAVTQFPVIVEAQPGGVVPKVRSAALKYSADGGTTWHDATLRSTGNGRYLATFPTPKDGDAISLKATLIDDGGNASELTTIAAYHLS
ncbi:S8 family serine peptidase [Kribbella sp. NPDC055071]